MVRRGPPAAAPFTAADAAAFLAQEAQKYEDCAIAEHREGASDKRVSFTRRIAGYYAAGAAAIRGESQVSEPATPTPEPDLDDLLA